LEKAIIKNIGSYNQHAKLEYDDCLTILTGEPSSSIDISKEVILKLTHTNFIIAINNHHL
jgi:hypothetical protein